jgi:hypothetical protein
LFEFWGKRRREQYQERRDGEATESSRQETKHTIGPSERRTGANCSNWREKHASGETDDSQTDNPDDDQTSAVCEFNGYPPFSQWFPNGPGQMGSDNDRKAENDEVDKP